MAQGTMTFVSRIDYGNGEKAITVSFPGDTAYPTGGTVGADVLAALRSAISVKNAAETDANVRGPENVAIKDIVGGDCGQYEPYWVSGKLKVLDGGHATRDEVTAVTALNGTTFYVTFLCD